MILLEVPRDVRLQRVKKRSFQKFGSRMLLGGEICMSGKRNFFVLLNAETRIQAAL